MNVFIDESGVLNLSDTSSRFYILTFVFHEQNVSFDALDNALIASWRHLGLEHVCFHAGPIIRQTDEYSILNWETRSRLFSAMMAFARKLDFRYVSFVVDKSYVTSSERIVAKLEADFSGFLSRHSQLRDCDKIRIHYDCGQQTITNLLHRIFPPDSLPPAEFIQGVRPENYRLFQLADMICSLELIACRFEHHLPMTSSEYRFFGGPRHFKRDILGTIRKKSFQD